MPPYSESYAQVVCQLPGCGVTTLIQSYRDCQVWVDKDDNGSPHFLIVCPEHKAKYLRLVSDFLSGD